MSFRRIGRVTYRVLFVVLFGLVVFGAGGPSSLAASNGGFGPAPGISGSSGEGSSPAVGPAPSAGEANVPPPRASGEEHLYPAVVLEATEVRATPELGSLGGGVQEVKLRVLKGPYAGREFTVENHLSGQPAFDVVAHPGDRVLVAVVSGPTGPEVYITDYYRENYLLYLVLLFAAALVAVGRKKGISAIVTLTVTFSLIVGVLVPYILKGYPPVPLALGIVLLITVVAMTFVAGFNRKSLAAILGTLGGVLVAGFLAFFVGTRVRLTGLSGDEAQMLLYIPQGIALDFRGLLFAGILLGALGAVMDVAISIASSVEEVHRANPELGRWELFRAGMNVGEDIMGTMANTLILAYAGSGIPLLLLFTAYGASLHKILNLDVIATEIVRALTGSIGLVAAIPLTAFFAALLATREKLRRS